MSRSHVRDTADVLLEIGKITEEQMARLRQELAGRPGMDAATWLLKENLVDSNDVLMAKAHLNGLEFRRIKPEDVDKQTFEKLDNLDGEEDGDTDGGPLADPSHAAFCFATLLHHFDGGNDAAPIPDFDHDGHHW